MRTPKLTIFLVEDNEMDSLFMDHKLRETLVNYNLITFSTGEECLRNLHLEPDLVILDYMLAGKNGLEILKQVKAINENIPVVLISNQREVEVVVEAFHQGATDYIIKGSNAHIKLRDLVENLCEIP
jgi:two-component system, NtrC family, response regulator AtoC